MKTLFRQSFARDLKKVKDEALLARVAWIIGEFEVAQSLREFTDLK
jgi:hypothetical protein